MYDVGFKECRKTEYETLNVIFKNELGKWFKILKVAFKIIF